MDTHTVCFVHITLEAARTDRFGDLNSEPSLWQAGFTSWGVK